MNIYKNFFIKTLILMIIIPILIIIMTLFLSNYLVGNGFVKYGESEMVHGWLMQKKQIAEELSQKGAKVVFLSGSNALFGVNAEEIEKVTGRQTLNYGSHAGLSTYIFYDAKQILKNGDTVILPLEANYYSDDGEINSMPTTLVEYIISYDNNYYKQLPINNKLKILAYLIRFKTITYMGRKNKDYLPELSPRGDFNNIRLDENYAKTANPDMIVVEKLSDNYKKWELYKFIQWCKEKDIKVYAFAPNIYHKATATKEEQNSFIEIKKFYKLAGVRFIGEFEDGFFGLKYMYNTNYHLNQSGQKIRTEYFLQKLRGEIYF